MTYKLRIAASLAFGLTAVVICVMWVRSYWWFEGYSIKQSTYHAGIAWCAGVLVIEGTNPANPNRNAGYFWSAFDDRGVRALKAELTYGFDLRRWNNSFVVAMPIWAVLIATLLCMAQSFAVKDWPCVPSRFSLRTLLMATTLLAVALGMVVWVVRR
jgi:hypothetical protein